MIELPVGTWVYPVKMHAGRNAFALNGTPLTKIFLVQKHYALNDNFGGLADVGNVVRSLERMNERGDRNFRLVRFPKPVQDVSNRYIKTIGFIFDAKPFKEDMPRLNIRFDKYIKLDGTTHYTVEASEWEANGEPSPITGHPLSGIEIATGRCKHDVVNGEVISTTFTLENGDILKVLND